MPAPTVPVPAANGQSLASMYDIQDLPFEFTPSEPVPVAAAATVPTVQPATGVAPAVPPPLAPSAQPKHPEWLTRHATELGLHPISVDSLDTAALTRVVMDEMAKVRSERSQHSAAVAAFNGNQPVVPVTPAEPEWDWGVHDDIDDRGQPVKRKFTDADIAPAVGNHIKRLDKEIKELKVVISQFQQGAAQAGQSRVQNEFDAAFNKIGGVFGTGSAGQLRGKPEFDRRASVYAAVKGMFAALPAEMRQTMTIEQAVVSMAKSMYNIAPVAAAATPGRNGVPTADQFVTGGVQPPTDRRGSDKAFGREKAIEESQAWWKEQQAAGGIPASGGTSLDEFLP